MDDRYSTLDEAALRKLLEVTSDLDERRLIRSAIHELRRKELQGMEEILATKRFRSENSRKLLENKENCLRSPRQQEESRQGSLDNLSRKLETITDIEQLTELLHGTTEYEERKLIRVAIRNLRDQEIQAVLGKCGSSSRKTENEKVTPIRIYKPAELTDSSHIKQPQKSITEDLQGIKKTRTSIQELKSQRDSQDSKGASKDMASDMMFALDGIQVLPPIDCNQSGGTDHGSTDSDLESESGKESSTESQRDAECNEWRSLSEEGINESSSGVEDEDEENEQENDSKQADEEGDENGTDNEHHHLHQKTLVSNDKQSSITEDHTQQSRTPGSRDTSYKSYLGLSGRSTQELPHLRFGGCEHSLASLLSPLPSMPRYFDRKGRTAESKVDGLCLSRINTVKDRMKKFTEDSTNLSAEVGADFSPLKRTGALRTSRAPQFHHLPSENCVFSSKLSSSPRNRDTRSIPPTPEHVSQRAAENKNDRLTESIQKKGNHTSFGLGEVLPTGHPGCKEQTPSSLIQPDVSSAAADRQSAPGNCTSEESSGRQKKSAAEAYKDTLILSNAENLETDSDALLRKRVNYEEISDSMSGHSNRAVTNKQKRTPCGRDKINQSEQNGLVVVKEQNSNGAKTLNHSEQPSLDFSTPVGQQRLLDCKYTRDGKDPKHCSSELKSIDADMKTLLTIEIKEGQSSNMNSRITGTPSSKRAELSLGLKPSPFKITSTPGSGLKMESDLVVPPEQPVKQEEQVNGLKEAQSRTTEKSSKLTQEELSAIDDLEVLDKMLDQAKEFEERKMIRAAMRELRTRKRDQREKEREMRLQEMKQKAQEEKATKAGCAVMTVTTKTEKSADGSSLSSLTKTQKLTESEDRSKTSRMMTMASSYVKRSETSATYIQTKSSYSSSTSVNSSSSTPKKVGSVFDREDDTTSRSSSLAALERRQAEKKKEMMRSQSLPKTSAAQARKAMIEKLEKDGGSPNPAVAIVKVQRASSFGVPNANSIKQMLLDWCRAKTRGYENVEIQNFSSSWSDGMAFCALVHSFFPDAFDFSQLAPQNRRQNFELAFAAAEKHADCPQLLDTDDMVRMREPDWKCVYTYVQEFYRCLVQKGLVKTKNS